MTVLSRALIRKIIIQEMRLSAPSRSFNRPIDIDNDTEIDAIPSFMDDQTEPYIPLPDEDISDDKTEFDFDADIDAFGFDEEYDDDDFEFESETEEDSESETEYNPGRHVMDMSQDEIRRHVMSAAERLSPDMTARNMRTRAEMRYDDLVRQGREAEMPDPEFEDTINLTPKELREHIGKTIRQSIRRQMLLI